MLVLIGTLLWTLAVSVQASPHTWVTIQNAAGKDILGLRAEQRPYAPDVPPRVGSHFNTGQPPKDSQGRVISGAGFYGWQEGEAIHVVALMLVPDPGAENRFYADAEDTRLHYEVAARFQLRAGESRELTELFDGRFKALRAETRSDR